jgi:hypothetical protein
MILVMKHIETFQVTEDQFGVIDNHGNWKMPLNNSFFASSEAQMLREYKNIVIVKGNGYRRPPLVDNDFEYLGDGIFRVFHTSRDNRVHNVLTGNAFDLTGSSSGRSTPVSMEINDGYGVYVGTDGQRTAQGQKRPIYSFNANGKLTKIINPANMVYQYSIGVYSDGLFYARGREENMRFPDGSDDKVVITPGFYDIAGKLQIDLSEYKLDSSGRAWATEGDSLYFSDGYCVLNILNPQGSRYYTVIDKAGKRMFEPRQSPGKFEMHTTKCGMVVLKDAANASTFDIIDASSGQSVMPQEWKDANRIARERRDEIRYFISDYNDDVAKVEKNAPAGFNRKKEIFYIDKMGKRLF